MYDKTELLLAKTNTLMVIAQTQAAAMALKNDPWFAKVLQMLDAIAQAAVNILPEDEYQLILGALQATNQIKTARA